MKKWLIIGILLNVIVIGSSFLYLRYSFLDSLQIKIVQQSHDFTETESEFIFSYSLELFNNTNEDYHVVIPELASNLQDIINDKMQTFIDLKAGSHVIFFLIFL